MYLLLLLTVIYVFCKMCKMLNNIIMWNNAKLYQTDIFGPIVTYFGEGIFT